MIMIDLIITTTKIIIMIFIIIITTIQTIKIIKEMTRVMIISSDNIDYVGRDNDK